MYASLKSLWAVFSAILLMTGLSNVAFGSAVPAQSVNLPEIAAGYVIQDDGDSPDVTARVARISFITGDAQIRRGGSEDWETAALNLPLVEGDEIYTAADSRLELQFDRHKHLRLAENSLLKIAKLADEGIAVSLSLGTLSLRLTSFEIGGPYFEIDAPKTTIAVQSAGTYRIDAGTENDNEVRVSALDGGEARVYSDSLGFTLKNGRSAVIYISGELAGEWQGAAAAHYLDEFDEWAARRDNEIADRLKDAHYGKYYDDDIYGADDLNDYGDWVHSSSYGYVWRPHRSSLNRYADWSPYRYGHWRWMNPYGWIWVNDEPWGWATYHHGRWLHDNGYWFWSPYGYYRTTRSWWFPALVVITTYNNNVCWYPLPYHRRYQNYNGRHRYRNNNPVPPGTGGIKPIPNSTPVRTVRLDPRTDTHLPAEPNVPLGGVVTVAADDFGVKTRGVKTAPLNVAKSVLAIPAADQAVLLPNHSPVRVRAVRDMAAKKPRIDTRNDSRVGAAPRTSGAPIDKDLRTKRVLGTRPQTPVTSGPEGSTAPVRPSPDTRKQGSVDRTPTVRVNPPIRQAPVEQPPVRVPRSTPAPVRAEPPPVRQPPTRSEPAPTRQPPRTTPSPPAKSEPKPESKPTKPSRVLAD